MAKQRRYKRDIDREGEFYEAMPAAARPVYMKDPVIIEREHDYERDNGWSGWVLAAVLIIGLLLLLMLVGRVGNGINTPMR